MRESAFDVLAAPPQQTLPPVPPQAPTVRMHRVAGVLLLVPGLRAAGRFAEVGAEAVRLKVEGRAAAVIALYPLQTPILFVL